MLKNLLSIATVAWMGLLSAQAEITTVLTPDPSCEVTDLATVKIKFDGAEVITKPDIKNISATLTNETTDTRYVAVKVNYSWSEPDAATLLFGVEGADTALGEIKDDGTYKLSIAAGSFTCYNVDPAYYSPLIEATYTIGSDEPKDSMSEYTLAPAAGEVSELNTITVNFPGTGFMGIDVQSTEGITLTYDSGTKTRVARVVKHIYKYGSDCGLQFDWEDASVAEPLTFMAPGTYTLDIPAGAFSESFASPVNRRITATYTIVAQGGAMSSYSVIPAAGEVKEIKAVELNFGGNEVNSLQFAEDLSGITITRKGELKTVWHCLNAVSAGTSSSAVLTFAREGGDTPATINAPGEYLLTIPAGMISGYTSAGRKANDAIQLMYTITEGVNNMNVYTLTPDGEAHTELNRIVIDFYDVQDGVEITGSTGDISLVFTPKSTGEDSSVTPADETVSETYHPRGCQISGGEVTLVFGTADGSSFTADGIYALSVPEGCFGEYGNSASVSPLIEKTFVIDSTQSGITDVNAEAVSSDVYNMQGIKVRAAGDSRALPAGLYISGGKKFRIAE